MMSNGAMIRARGLKDLNGAPLKLGVLLSLPTISTLISLSRATTSKIISPKSLGSTVDYTFSNPEKNIHHEGSAHGHVEKNWGQTFPGGHVWLQAFAPDNNSQLKTSAPFETFLDAVLAPMTKVDWEPACRESFVATAEVKVYEHVAWGILGTSNLVETQSFEFAALEFGEDLLKEGEESEANQNWSLEDPIF